MSDDDDDAPAVERRQPRPTLLETVRSTMECSCGWKATGRTPAASSAGWSDHVAFVHGLAWATETADERRKAS